MYVGHSLLAFALGASFARRAGVRRSLVLPVGMLAAGFALVPDVDAAYTAFVVVQAPPEQLFPTPEYVWTDEAWRVHRALTHSLIVGAVASVGVGFLELARVRRWDLFGYVVGTIAIGSFAGILAAGYSSDGATGLLTAGLYVAGALALVTWARRWSVPPRWLGGAAAIGLLTHPFGDLFMGRPPAFLYPVVSTSPIARISVAPDPTVNLIVLFGLELALAWAVVWTVSVERDWQIREATGAPGLLGVGFAAAAFVITPPTLQVAYHFALGTLATGFILGVVPGVARVRGSADRRSIDYRTGIVTGLAAVSLAAVAYLLAFLVVGG